MTLKTDSPFETDPPIFLLENLTTRALEKHEHALAGQLLEQQYYLGDCPSGRLLLQVAEYQGHWVALPDWGPSCWKLAARETPIGWTHQQRAQRLGFVVQNRHFLVLGQERMPNLASHSVSLALRALRALESPPRLPPPLGRDLHRHRTVRRRLLQSNQLEPAETDQRLRATQG